jgi:membrane peptidoglycan carboxypeptidase
MLLAFLLQYRMTKIDILRWYLQEMYLGSGIYGIESAAQRIFAKSSYELMRQEAAIIAAMMVYPRPLVPTSAWKEKIDRRSGYGLRLFAKFGGRYKQRFE